MAQEQTYRVYCLENGQQVSDKNPDVYYYQEFTIVDRKREGKYYEYYLHNKALKKEGKYKEGIPVGKWKTYYDNGQQEKGYNLVKETRKGFGNTYREKLASYWTKEGAKMIHAGQGSYTTFHENGKEAWKGYYTNYFKIGEWTYHTEDGFLRHKEVYTTKKVTGTTFLLREERMKYDGHKVLYSIPKIAASADPDQQVLYKHIITNLRYPRVAKRKGIEGQVIVSFYVEEDGSLSELKIEHSIDPTLDEEALRVMKVSPKWKQRQVRGLAVRRKEYFPINFKLI